MNEFGFVYGESERYSRRFGVHQEPGEQERLQCRLLHGEKNQQVINIGNRRISNLGGPLEHILDHAPAVDPVNGPDEHPVPDENLPLDLLEHRLHHAEELRTGHGRVGIAIRAGVDDDDAHEIGLGGSNKADGLVGEEGGGGREVDGGWGGGGNEVFDGLAGTEEVAVGLARGSGRGLGGGGGEGDEG